MFDMSHTHPVDVYVLTSYRIKQTRMSSLSARVYHDDDSQKGMIQLLVPNNENIVRPNVQLIFTVDISGSMCSAAICKGENGQDLNQGWTNLDINIHSILVSIGMLNDGDCISIVTFDSNARTVLDWTYMNNSGKHIAEECVRKLKTQGMTNLTEAINETGKLMKTSQIRENCVSAVILYTDGEPTCDVQRPSKYKQQFDKIKEEVYESTRIQYSIFSLAIGNSVDSFLLTNISHVSHIPQTQFLCAFTVNLMALIFNVYKSGSHIFSNSILTVEGCVNFDLCEYTETKTLSDDRKCINIGIISNGMNRNIPYTGDKVKEITLNGFSISCTKGNDKTFIENEHIRLRAVNAIKKKDVNEINKIMSVAGGDLQETLREVNMGIEQYNQTWGKHFPYSISQAMFREIRTNYIDKVIQKYTSEMFEKYCDIGESVFAKVKPPEPSLLQRIPTNSAVTRAAPMVMPDEFLRGGGCLANPNQNLSCKINEEVTEITIAKLVGLFVDKKEKPENILIKSTNGYSEIECLVITETNKNTVVCDVYGIHLTQWHPIKIIQDTSSGEWTFPSYLSVNIVETPQYVYNIVLVDRSNIIIPSDTCSIEYATPGHEKTTEDLNEVSYHPYWATESYITDLKQFSTYSKGYVKNVMFEKAWTAKALSPYYDEKGDPLDPENGANWVGDKMIRLRG